MLTEVHPADERIETFLGFPEPRPGPWAGFGSESFTFSPMVNVMKKEETRGDPPSTSLDIQDVSEMQRGILSCMFKWGMMHFWCPIHQRRFSWWWPFRLSMVGFCPRAPCSGKHRLELKGLVLRCGKATDSRTGARPLSQATKGRKHKGQYLAFTRFVRGKRLNPFHPLTNTPSPKSKTAPMLLLFIRGWVGT